MATTSFSAALLLLLATAVVVQGQGGQLSVKLSEADFANHESDGNLVITVIVTQAGSAPGPNPIEFSFEALTQAQYDARLAAPESSLDCSSLNPENDDLGGENELVTTNINCTLMDPSGVTGSAVSKQCSFPIVQDGVFERDEYLVIIMTVTDNGGNTIENTRNCAIGRILLNDNPAEEVDFRLTTPSGPFEVTEGETLNLVLTRQFITMLPILVTIRSTRNITDPNVFIQGPMVGSDFTADRMDIVFPGDQTTLTIPIEFFQDDIPEGVERVSFGLTASVETGSSTTENVPVEESAVPVVVFDDEVLTTGFKRTENSIDITEGETVVLVIEPKNYDFVSAIFPDRNIIVNVTTIDDNAVIGTDYSITRPTGPDNLNIQLTFDSISFTIETVGDDMPQVTRSFQVLVVDEVLAGLTNAEDRVRHSAVNIINPGSITINILDDDGTPNQPTVTFGDGPTFEWNVDEEGQTRPVDCFYGNVTVREPSGEQEVVAFDSCSGSGPMSEFDLPNFDEENEYVVIVCSRNSLGDACTAPLTHIPPPPVVTVAPTTVAPTTVVVPTTAVAGMTGLQGGAIAGIIVGLLLGCCLFWLLLLLLIFCCCCGAREKRYFPQHREEMFAKQGHKHDAHFSAGEYDTVKVPLD